jgi:hypothetical protein
VDAVPAASSPRLSVAVGELLARLLDGPPLIPGDVDSSVLPRSTHDQQEHMFLLRRGPRQS